MTNGVPAVNEEEIDLLKWALLLWRKRFWILGGGLLLGLLGAIFAYLTTPIYRSEAIISPKMATTTSRTLSGLGGLGGLVATQIDAGNTPLDRLELIATSRTLARDLIEENDLLPDLYPRLWDKKHHQWKSGKAPNLDGAAEYLRSGVLSFTSDRKKNAIILGIETYDPNLAKRLVDLYLAGLNKNIRDAVRMDSDSSRFYLETQMAASTDPQIILKIQQLIGQEIEKATLVSARAFDVIEAPWVPRGPKWPKKGQIIGIAVFLGLFLGTLGVLVNEKIQEFRRSLHERR